MHANKPVLKKNVLTAEIQRVQAPHLYAEKIPKVKIQQRELFEPLFGC